MAEPLTRDILLWCVLFALGLHDFLTNFEENGCEMTYMFQYPQYTKINLKKNVKEKFPRYDLYIYGEGEYAVKLRSLKLTGIPVLFIPGNAGSYKQVRSLASVALQKSNTREDNIHFNYFSVDLNEEMSGIYGGVLQDQTEFVHECIKAILKLYKSSTHIPDSVVVVGHSMGGMVARGLFTLPDFDPKLVHLIITQATPHRSPVIDIDIRQSEFYDKVNGYWRDNMNCSLKDVTVFSTGGGYRDILVRNRLTSLDGIIPEERSISSQTMSVPKAWVSTDHLCIVWCKQTVLVTKRAMFDVIDTKKRQITRDVDHKVAVFRHHFVHHSGTKKSPGVATADSTTVKLNTKTKWEVKKQKSWNFFRDISKSTRYLVVPVQKGKSFVAVSNVDLEDWIIGCTADANGSCSEGISLASKGSLIPPMKSGKKMILLRPENIEGFSHLILVVPKDQTLAEITAELYNPEERNISFEPPPFFQRVLKLLKGFPKSIMESEPFLESTSQGAVFYNISLPSLSMVWQAYAAQLLTINCEKTDSGNFRGNLMMYNEPWSQERTYAFSSLGQTGNLSLKLHAGMPDNSRDAAEFHLVLHPGCTYKVQIAVAYKELFGQYVRFYALLLPSYIVANILMALLYQLKCLGKPDGDCPTFLYALGTYGQSWRVVLIAGILARIARITSVYEQLVGLGIPDNDHISLDQKDISWHTLHGPVLYLLATAIVVVNVWVITATIAVIGRIAELLLRIFRPVIYLSFLKYPALLGAAYAAYFHCGALGLQILYMIALIKVLYYSIESRVSDDREGATRQYNLHFSLLLVWMVLYILNSPAFIVWVKNLRYTNKLMHDPSSLTALAATGVMFMIDLGNHTSLNRSIYKWVSSVMHLLTVIMLMYAVESIYRIPYFIVIMLGLLGLAQVVQQRVPPVQHKQKAD
ncbi:GPI inositol-deacylase-like [Lingula anatina]|uniref:GPI inositol-deacylase n=1 Tax=Lingula anatina TaxID=7574 RepID=A0A2R2MIZ5_LINAN|nr:GPI inositol-deacylase-like [Lingula anatina]|eukprot:XP_023930190.1 GPI inositol-deacylase-like [Lingula anatina]